jgi:hypothetical protein
MITGRPSTIFANEIVATNGSFVNADGGSVG